MYTGSVCSQGCLLWSLNRQLHISRDRQTEARRLRRKGSLGMGPKGLASPYTLQLVCSPHSLGMQGIFSMPSSLLVWGLLGAGFFFWKHGSLREECSSPMSIPLLPSPTSLPAKLIDEWKRLPW